MKLIFPQLIYYLGMALTPAIFFTILVYLFSKTKDDD